MKTLGASQFVGDLERFLRLAPPLLERLKRDSGLSDYEELASVDPSERLSAAFARVQARFESIPEEKRGLPLFEAMREVARLCVMYSGISAIAFDVFIIRSVPYLSPLVALSPAIGAIKQMLDATRMLLEGRSIEARKSLLKLLERLAEPDHAGLGELYHRSLRLGGVYILGVVEASLGMASAEERANELQDEPGHRVNAQRIHMTARLVHGEMEGAAAAQRHAELLMLQEAQYQRYPGTTARSELQVSAMLEDVTAIKELTERMAKTALLDPRWGIYVHLGRHYHRRLQRDFAGALAALEPAFAVTAPLDHRDWSLVAAAHVQALSDLGRSDEAVRVGREYLDTCRKLAISTRLHSGRPSPRERASSTGATDEAASLADALIEDVTSWQAGGLAVEMLYELRARVALAQRDEEALARCLSLCRREHEGQLVPALSTRIHRLMRDAKRAGMLRANLQDEMDFDRTFLAAINLETTARTHVSDALDPAMFENTQVEEDLTTTAVLLSPGR